MAVEQATGEAVARVLERMADRLDADEPDSVMTAEARVGLICQFTPGQPDLFDRAFPATPAVICRCTRGEYAAGLRSIAGGA